MRCYNVAMLVDCVIALLASVLVLPLAWIKWTQWRQAGSKPLQFSLGRLFLAMTIFSLAAWSFTRTEPWEKGEWINGLVFPFLVPVRLLGCKGQPASWSFSSELPELQPTSFSQVPISIDRLHGNHCRIATRSRFSLYTNQTVSLPAAGIACSVCARPAIMRPCKPSRPKPIRRSANAAGFNSACGR
jgi:hypothetical protein